MWLIVVAQPPAITIPKGTATATRSHVADFRPSMSAPLSGFLNAPVQAAPQVLRLDGRGLSHQTYPAPGSPTPCHRSPWMSIAKRRPAEYSRSSRRCGSLVWPRIEALEPGLGAPPRSESGRSRTRPVVSSKTAPTSFMTPSAWRALTSGVSSNCRSDQRTLASTAASSCCCGASSARTSRSPGRMFFSKTAICLRSCAPRNCAASAACTAPQLS